MTGTVHGFSTLGLKTSKRSKRVACVTRYKRLGRSESPNKVKPYLTLVVSMSAFLFSDAT